MSAYDKKPARFLEQIHLHVTDSPNATSCCAGFELSNWRCAPFANHLVEWLPDYALPEEELNITHGNMFVKLQQAAVRVYTSTKYATRGEAGEIALHAICRDFFATTPISPRVFYKSSSNDVVKSFDLVHARITVDEPIELWLGESKLYADAADAIKAAIASVKAHLDQGFLTSQKLILGPQIPKSTPRYEELIELFKSQTSLDKLIKSAVFVIGILANSPAVKAAKESSPSYRSQVAQEIATLRQTLANAGLPKVRLLVIYVPLLDKDELASCFDAKLKGIQ
jgi:hypothetical protein